MGEMMNGAFRALQRIIIFKAVSIQTRKSVV